MKWLKVENEVAGRRLQEPSAAPAEQKQSAPKKTLSLLDPLPAAPVSRARIVQQRQRSLTQAPKAPEEGFAVDMTTEERRLQREADVAVDKAAIARKKLETLRKRPTADGKDIGTQRISPESRARSSLVDPPKAPDELDLAEPSTAPAETERYTTSGPYRSAKVADQSRTERDAAVAIQSSFRGHKARNSLPHVVSLPFVGLNIGSVEFMSKLAPEMLQQFRNRGVTQMVLSMLTLSFRAGHIAEIRGPLSAVKELWTCVSSRRVSVLGYSAIAQVCADNSSSSSEAARTSVAATKPRHEARNSHSSQQLYNLQSPEPLLTKSVELTGLVSPAACASEASVRQRSAKTKTPATFPQDSTDAVQRAASTPVYPPHSEDGFASLKARRERLAREATWSQPSSRRSGSEARLDAQEASRAAEQAAASAALLAQKHGAPSATFPRSRTPSNRETPAQQAGYRSRQPLPTASLEGESPRFSDSSSTGGQGYALTSPLHAAARDLKRASY